jgi:hypothetical protein
MKKFVFKIIGLFRPKKRPVDPEPVGERCCGNCKFTNRALRQEPCRSCDIYTHAKWKPGR